MSAFFTTVHDAISLKRLKSLAHVTAKGDRVTFGRGWTKEAATEKLNEIASGIKIIENKEVKAFKPSQTDFDLVQARMVGGKHKVKDFGYFRVSISDTKIDFADERIPKDILEKFIPQAKAGVTVLVNHGQDHMIGSTFKAELVRIDNDQANWELIFYFYVPPYKTVPEGGLAIDDIQTGVLKYASIAFKNNKIKLVEAGERMVIEYVLDETDPPILVEMSMVYRGMNGGSMIKNFGQTSRNYNFQTSKKSTMKKYMIKGGPSGTEGGRKEFEVKTKMVGEGDDAVAELVIPDGLQADIDAMHKKALTADGLAAEVKAIKTPMADAIVALQKKLDLPEDSVDGLSVKSLSDLGDIQKKLEAVDAKQNKKGQTAGGKVDTTTGEEKAEAYPY